MCNSGTEKKMYNRNLFQKIHIFSFSANNIIKFERTDFMRENFNSGKDENINLTILNEINKAAKMGMDSISYVLKKVGDENMKENLTSQYTEYGKIVDRVNNQFDKYGEIPDEAPVTDKMMAWMGTQMNTMTDKSNSKIAELMIQGGDMGIIKCQKLLNHNPRADEPVKNILNDFVTLQKNDIEQMTSILDEDDCEDDSNIQNPNVIASITNIMDDLQQRFKELHFSSVY